MKLGDVHRSHRIYLTVEENRKKSQLGDHWMMAVQLVLTSKGPLLPIDVDRVTQHIREGEGTHPQTFK
jgi:hypothetical protein